MLNPATLLADTAKFFQLNPNRFRKHGLTGSGVNPALVLRNDECFCTVGYMAYRLAKESPTLREKVKVDPYRAVSDFFGTLSSSELYEVNDGSGRVSTIDFLKDKAREFA